MILAARHPVARLAPLLHGPLIGWSEQSRTPQPCRELPFPGLPLILSFGEPFRLKDTRSHREPLVIGSFVAGLDDWYTESLSPFGSSAIQVNLTPAGARRIFGIPLETITRQVLPFDSVFGAIAAQLEDQLATAATWDRRFDLLEHWLLGRLDRTETVRAEVDWVWEQLHESRGTASIGALGQTLGWSRQRMVTTCRRELGMPPKLLARVVRFHGMTRRLRQRRATSWSALAAECGYHDQSHLIRDTRDFAGCTPRELPGHLPLSLA